MIHEYALEPELVASWHDRVLGRFFIEQFGFGTGRVVSRYPKKWRKLCWDAFQAAFGAAAGEIERKRVEELLARLTMPEVRRTGYVWDDARSWLQNAEQEHSQRPFYAILARESPHNQPNVMCADDVLAGTPAGWSAPNSIVVDRVAASMTQGIAPMLRSARRIVFVDPRFRASRPRFRTCLVEFLRLAALSALKPVLELHTGHISDDAPDWETFQRECERYLPGLIPAGLTLVIRRWKQRTGGDRPHNRYVLTDIGGVEFGFGLDEGDPGTTDDVTLLSADSYRRRFEDYTGSAPAFDLEGEVRILGRAIA